MKHLLLLFVLLPLLAVAQVPDPKPGTYVNDLANVLSGRQVYTLNDSLLSIEKQSSVQMAVVVVSHLPQGVEVEDYAREVGRKWHVGKADNGLVFVLSTEDHKMRLEVARQLEGDIPDIEASRIIESLKPYFHQKQWFEGLQHLIVEVKVRIDPAAAAQMRLVQLQAHRRDKRAIMMGIYVLLGLGAGGGLFWLLRRKRKKAPPHEVNFDDTDLMYYPTYASHVISSDAYSYTPSSSSESISSSDSGSSSSDSSSFGDFGSDSGSSDSGFSGGGASGDF